MTPERVEQLAAEQVLGLLEGEDAALAQSLMASDPAFRAAVERWWQRFSEIDETTPELSPPSGLWHRIEASLQETIVPVVSAPPVRARTVPSPYRLLWDSLMFWRVTALGAAVASLALAVGMGIFAERALRQPVLVVVMVDEQNRPGAVLHAFAEGPAELIPLSGTAVPPDRTMQVWTIAEPNGPPVSVGLLPVAKTTELNLDKLPVPRDTQHFAISIEPPGGSPTGRPTGPVVLQGDATRAL